MGSNDKNFNLTCLEPTLSRTTTERTEQSFGEHVIGLEEFAHYHLSFGELSLVVHSELQPFLELFLTLDFSFQEAGPNLWRAIYHMFRFSAHR